MKPELTVKEFASRERVTERTVWRWIDKGAVPVRRTPGGGIRIQEPSECGAIVTSSDKAGHSAK